MRAGEFISGPGWRGQPGGAFTGPCPACGAPMSVEECNGRLELSCGAACTEDRICAARGITEQDLRFDDAKSNGTAVKSATAEKPAAEKSNKTASTAPANPTKKYGTTVNPNGGTGSAAAQEKPAAAKNGSTPRTTAPTNPTTKGPAPNAKFTCEDVVRAVLGEPKRRQGAEAALSLHATRTRQRGCASVSEYQHQEGRVDVRPLQCGRDALAVGGLSRRPRSCQQGRSDGMVERTRPAEGWGTTRTK
jgi:hypothetical protein